MQCSEVKQLGWKKGKSNQKWLIPYSIHFPGKITKSLKKTSKMLWPHCAPNPMQIDQYKRKCSAVLDRPLVQWGEANWLTKKGASFALKNHASLLLFSSNHDRLISILRVEQVSASSGRSTRANFDKNCPKTVSPLL